MIGKTFVYKSPYGGVTTGKIKEQKGRIDLDSTKTFTTFVLSENNNAYRLDEIQILENN